ncbi:hypothetical protein B0T10DRAFT_465008 [Thelonectria olida]|uniref:Uncharacterized protein n=1 Tax=Thelonectria olida TaxID=1576542 RepID=A0A9P8VT87_9HYPO|nr:hypothetical protein B0T10DRAFT_465008 [Thelonectria olida]
MLGILGEPTVAAFASLSKDGRRHTFRRCLVEDEPIEFDGIFEWQCCRAVYTFRLFMEHLNGDEAAQQLIQEARCVFYEENTFVMSSNWLNQFLNNKLGNGEKPASVESLVRHITVQVDRRYCNATNLASSLLDLFRMTNPERISLEILDRGVPDGRDFATQETIKRISCVVQDLIDYFGRRLTVSKVTFSDDDFKDGLATYPADFCDIKSYWNLPTKRTREKALKGQVSFEELMQIQIEEWTDQSFDPYPLNAVDDLRS